MACEKDLEKSLKDQISLFAKSLEPTIDIKEQLSPEKKETFAKLFEVFRPSDPKDRDTFSTEVDNLGEAAEKIKDCLELYAEGACETDKVATNNDYRGGDDASKQDIENKKTDFIAKLGDKLATDYDKVLKTASDLQDARRQEAEETAAQKKIQKNITSIETQIELLLPLLDANPNNVDYKKIKALNNELDLFRGYTKSDERGMLDLDIIDRELLLKKVFENIEHLSKDKNYGEKYKAAFGLLEENNAERNNAEQFNELATKLKTSAGQEKSSLNATWQRARYVLGYVADSIKNYISSLASSNQTPKQTATLGVNAGDKTQSRILSITAKAQQWMERKSQTPVAKQKLKETPSLTH